MNHFFRIVKMVKGYKFNAVMVIVFSITYALFSALSLVCTIPLFQILFKEKPTDLPYGDGLKDWFYKHLNYYLESLVNEKGIVFTLIIVCIIIIMMFFFKTSSYFLSMKNLAVLRNNLAKDLRNSLHKKILHLPVSFFSEQRKGDLLARASTDINEVEWTMLNSLIYLVRSPIMIIIQLVILFWLNAELTFFVFILLPISGVIIGLTGKNLKKDANEAQGLVGKIISMMEETLTGLKIYKIYNVREKAQEKFEESNEQFVNISNKVFTKKELASPVSEFLGAITMVILFAYGGKLILIDKTLLSSEFLGFIGIFFQIIDPAKRLAALSTDVKKGQAAAGRIFEIIDEPVRHEPDNAVENITFKDSLSFDQVSFSYDDTDLVLNNFTLKIPKGKTIALVGQSGSGKSTIANLLVRFYRPNKGSISIDNTSIDNCKVNAYRNLFGLVTQESILFNDTIKNNITLGHSYTDDEIQKAIKIANAKEFIDLLPNGLETSIGDAGGKLSGGQKQRLNIARAVLKNPPILILDEATSALDTESEKLVQEAIENIMKDRTVLVIAHRLSTIQKADNIVVMEKGKIIEQGNHDYLLNQKGKYAQLIQLQNFS